MTMMMMMMMMTMMMVMMMFMIIWYDQLHFLRYGSSLLTFYSMYPQTLPKNLYRFFIDSPNLWNPRRWDFRWGREIPGSLRIIIEGQGRDRISCVCWLLVVFSFRKRSQNFRMDTKIHIIKKNVFSWEKREVFQARHTSLSKYPMMFEDYTTSRMKMCRKWGISIQPMLNFLSNFGKGTLTENAEEFPPLFGVGLASWIRWVYKWHLSYENKTRFYHSRWVSIGLYHHWK